MMAKQRKTKRSTGLDSYMSEAYLEKPYVQAAINERIAVVRSYKTATVGEVFPIEWDLDVLAPLGLKFMRGPSDEQIRLRTAVYMYEHGKDDNPE